MSRRFFLLAAACSVLIMIGAAVAPWTVNSDLIAVNIARQCRELFGLDLQVTGRSTFALLPEPRIKLEEVVIKAPDGRVLAKAGQVRGELRVADLLRGGIELETLFLNGFHFVADLDTDGDGPWPRALARWAASVRNPERPHLRRFGISNATLLVRDGQANPHLLSDVALRAIWPARDRAAEVTASLRWRGEVVSGTLTLGRVDHWLAGLPTKLALQAAGQHGRVSFAGEASSPERRLNGRLSVDTPSVRNLVRWTGMPVPLAPALGMFHLEGEVSADVRGLASPAVRLSLGPDLLEGALSIRGTLHRPLVTGTLAADRLNLSDFLPILQAAHQPDGWSSDPFDLGPMTGADLDLRISASRAQLGVLKVDEMAGSLLIKAGRIEASLGRGTLANGQAKARVSIMASGSSVEAKLQGALDKVDAAVLLADFGQSRWLTGLLNGQIGVEASGESPAQLVRSLHGRGVITVRNGEIGGINLADLLKRAERRPIATAFDWRGGRTAFEQSQHSFTILGGVAGLEGVLLSPAVRGALQGRVSLVERALIMKATFDAGTPGAPATPAPLAFDIVGPFDRITIAPDARVLIERSDAAQPLLPPPPPAAPATVQ